MQKRSLQIALVAIAVAFIGFGTSELAYAQTAGTTTTPQGNTAVLAAFLVGGILWSISGYLSNWRTHIQFVNSNPVGTKDPNWNGFDRSGLRDDVLIGLAVGAVAFFTGSTLDIAPIVSMQTFVAAVIAATGAVAITDKIIVGTVLNR